MNISLQSAFQGTLVDADYYFQTKPLLVPVEIRECVYMRQNRATNVFPFTTFHLHWSSSPIVIFIFQYKDPNPQNNGDVCYCTGKLQHLNVSQYRFTRGCRNVGLNRLEIVDLNCGALEIITDDFFRNYKNLRFLNLSHHAFGVSGSDFQKTFSYLSRLEDISLSNNS